MSKIFISILNFNGKADTLKCLNSLKQVISDKYSTTVVVVDNGSSEDFDLREGDFKDLNLKIIKNKINLGFTGGHNLGFNYALNEGADYVVILNNDIIVDKYLIKELLAQFEYDEKVGATVPKMYFTKGHEYHKDRYKEKDLGKVFWYAGGIIDWKNMINSHRGVDEVDNGQYDEVIETEFASGACIMIKKEVLEKVGVFDDRYFLYYEDADLNMKIKKAGYKLIYAPKAILWHNNAGSSGSGSPLQDYYITRNRMLFGFSYAPLRTRVALFRESIALLRSGRRWQKKGIIDFYIRRFGKGSYK